MLTAFFFRMGFVGSLFRFTGKTAVLGAKVGIFVGSVQLTSELGVWVNYFWVSRPLLDFPFRDVIHKKQRRESRHFSAWRTWQNALLCDARENVQFSKFYRNIFPCSIASRKLFILAKWKETQYFHKYLTECSIISISSTSFWFTRCTLERISQILSGKNSTGSDCESSLT